MSNAQTVLGVHGRGHKGDVAITKVGGLDVSRRDKVAELIRTGFPAEVRRPGQSLAGAARDNICNRGKNKTGVRHEIPRSFSNQLARNADQLRNFANVIAEAMNADK